MFAYYFNSFSYHRTVEVTLVELKCVSIELGEHYAMISGTMMMQVLFVDNWDFHHLVGR